MSPPMVMFAYSAGCWNSGRTLLISVRKNAASNVPKNDPFPPPRLAPPSTAAAMLSSASLPMIGEPIWTSAAR